MHSAKYVLYFIGSLLLASCNGKIPSTASAPEGICKNTVLQTEETGSKLIVLNENMLGQANEKELPKASSPVDQLKYISQLSEETILQDKEVQGVIIQAIAQGWQNINQYVKEAYISFILEHVEKKEPQALVALLGLLKRYPGNSLLKSYKLKPEIYQELLTKLEKPTCDTNDGMHAYYIGKIYSTKEIQGLIPNASKTITYYKKALSMKNTGAAYALGFLYQHGMEGQLEPNAAKAIAYYKKVVKLENAGAAFALGSLYQYGMEGQLKSNTVKAIEYYEKAVSMGDAKAAYNLGLLYVKGIDGQLAPNTAKAIKYYQKAVSMGNDTAARNLTTLYEKGIRGQLTPNKQLAFKTYHDAYLANNKANYVKEGLLKFLVSNPSIKVSSSNVAEYQQELEVFRENVETLTGLILLKQEENNAISQAMQFKDCYIIPELYPCYNALIEYLDKVRNTIFYLLKPGFMVDCIKIKKNGKKRKVIADGDHLHTYLIGGQSYICLGENNVKAGKMLMSLLKEEKTVNQTVDVIRKMMMQGSSTKLGLCLYEQALKKLPSDYTGTVEEYIAARTRETLDMLNNMQALCTQLKDIVIATTSLRNKSSMDFYHFLQ